MADAKAKAINLLLYEGDLSGLAIQRLSDRVCAEHGLSIITPNPYRERQKQTVFPKK